jgi:hypothetical protein
LNIRNRNSFGRCVAPTFNVDCWPFGIGNGYRKTNVSYAKPPDVSIHLLDEKPIIYDELVEYPWFSSSIASPSRWARMRHLLPGWFIVTEFMTLTLSPS